jgi:aminopeptidase-like protein
LSGKILNYDENLKVGECIYEFAEKLWPLHRSLAGNENRKTLTYIKTHLPQLKVIEIDSGSQVYDWTVPDEWIVNAAYILTPSGEKICDVSMNNLHLVSYSQSYNGKISFEKLKKHLHYLFNQPDAIPYITSYYSKTWGFCISYNEYKKLEDGIYEIVIDTKFINGSISIGELYIPGKSKKEILFSTYICHPSMANNEISGIAVQTFLAKWVNNNGHNYYSYRFLFLPETIGSIAYINKNIQKLKKDVKVGFVLSCIGDERAFSLLANKKEKSYSSKIGKYVMSQFDLNYKIYDWRERGSDERQYGSPGVDLDVSVLMRSKFGEYPEYHTSLDKLGTVVTKEGLCTSLEMVKLIVKTIEADRILVNKIICEPMLSKHNLYPKISTKNTVNLIKDTRDIIDFADGSNTLLDLCVKYNLDIITIGKIALELETKGIVKTKRIQ